MIISPFRKYLNESSQDNWEIVDGRNEEDNKSKEKRKKITHAEVNNHRSFKQNRNRDQYNRIQRSIKQKRKHMVPYNNNVDQDEMDFIEKTNPALYAALVNWN